jgi:hypothetical protein
MTTNHDDDLQRHAQMGMAALIPGIQHVLDTIQRELDSLRTRLAAAQGGLALALPESAPRRGRPPKKKAKAAAIATRSSGWPSDPEERKREMARRRRKALRNQAKTPKALHPRDVGHPEHDKFAAKSKRAHKKYWAGLTVAERKARVAAMVAGRTKRVPEVRLAAAS